MTSTRPGTAAEVRDVDPDETQEWLDALAAVIRHDGRDRARHLLEAVVSEARAVGVPVDVPVTTPYRNSIPPDREERIPGDPEIERRLRSLVRWNALAMVLRANAGDSGLGGHIASFQSAATLYEVGFNHFWRAPSDRHGGDLVYIQGHSSPGIYARAFLEGRLTEEQLDLFRREVDGRGLSSYPHPWLMPDFWQFPTVSMGLGPITAIYQARFMKYLAARGLADIGDRKVWAFVGDGEMDEPESLGALSVAARERLDNLVFVVDCNLQRLDGPVRGNGKIIQELEASFRGAGWNVIKVIWGRRWDPLLEADRDGRLVGRMMEVLDGDYQTYRTRDGAYVREHFFGADPELVRRVQHMSDDEIWALDRGGHDPQRVYAAYAAATRHTGQPTVVLAKTIKGYGMGRAGEGLNITHQAKQMAEEILMEFRDRFRLPLGDEDVRSLKLHRPPDDAPEMQYLRARRAALGGPLPARWAADATLDVPPLEAFKSQLEGTGDRAVSTTMAFVRVLSALLRDKRLGRRIVPIVPDESRTFGMEGLFRQLGIYSTTGQLYQPEDRDQLMYYREDTAGQVLQEGITEAGAISSWIAAATSYANHDLPMVPFYIFYSMFGFQRVGDLAWAAGDARARGFLIGGTAGRTTLNGEGLQHADGHSHLLASVIPSCRSYDPAYAYELAVIVHDGLRRMYVDAEEAFYYVTVMNEAYPQPPLPDGAEEGIVRGMYRVRAAGAGPAVRLLGSGTILREALAAAELLEADFAVAAEVWSVTSFTELERDGRETERYARLNPHTPLRLSWVERCLGESDAPVLAATDYVRAVPEQIRPHVPAQYRTLGTDGYGRSDTRPVLRRLFEVDRHSIVVSALTSLGDEDAAEVAIRRYDVDATAPPPWRR